jgi:hypothetical protein
MSQAGVSTRSGNLVPVAFTKSMRTSCSNCLIKARPELLALTRFLERPRPLPTYQEKGSHIQVHPS